jgi:uncharacterized protein with FMN-binding domain
VNDTGAVVTGRIRLTGPRQLPQLRAEVLSAQGAHIDAVSGGYRESVRSALDAAHLGE